MQEEHIEVRRHARYFTTGASAEEATEIWYACHGYRQLANRFLRRFRELASASRLIVAPEALSRFYLEDGEGRDHSGMDRVGATWMTREDRLHEITDYVDYLDGLQSRVEEPRRDDPVKRVVLGFSQGVHTVCRWLALGNVSPDTLILWGAYPPDDLPDGAVETLNRCNIVVVRGKLDPYVTDEKHTQQVERMVQMGLRFGSMEHPGGHELHGDTLLEISHERDLGA